MAAATVSEAGLATRERILTAALQAFSEKGFDGATTRAIASRAGVNLGLIQYHFGGKAALWRAAVDRAFAELHVGLDRILEDRSAADERERTRRLIHAFVGFIARNPAFVRIMNDEGKRAGPRMRWLADRHVKPLFAGIGALLRGAQQRGFLPADIDPAHFLYILAGAVGLIFHQAPECRRLTGVDPFEPEAVEAHARAVTHFFLGFQPQEPGA